MTARRHKLNSSPLESPTEQLLLVAVTVEHKPSARAGQIWQAGARLPATRSLPPRGRITLH